MDVGAKREVLDLIKALKAEGVAVILISTEPETVLAEADRILVMSKGQIAKEFSGEPVSKDLLMSYAYAVDGLMVQEMPQGVGTPLGDVIAERTGSANRIELGQPQRADSGATDHPDQHCSSSSVW